MCSPVVCQLVRGLRCTQGAEHTPEHAALLAAFARLQDLVQRCLEGRPLVLEAWLAHEVTTSQLGALTSAAHGARARSRSTGPAARDSGASVPRRGSRSVLRRHEVQAVFTEAAGASAPALAQPPPLLEQRVAAHAERAVAEQTAQLDATQQAHSAAGGSSGLSSNSSSARRVVVGGSRVAFDEPNALERALD